jgi:Domain of unknown function (DUF4281)
MESRIFKLANTAVLPFWLLLIMAPDWSFTRPLVVYGAGVSLAVLYTWMLWRSWGKTPGGGFNSLAQVGRLFQHPAALLAGWIHYLVFDLLLGLFIATDAMASGFNRILLAICLVFTLLVGPFGFLLYLALQFVLYQHTF